MKIFLDSINIDEIKKFKALNLVDGITTNQSLLAKNKSHYKDILSEICSIISGPVSAPVFSTKQDAMWEEAIELTKIAPNIVIKIPATHDGFHVANNLNKKGHQTNITLCFTSNQAILAAKVGATYLSHFVGRSEDNMIGGIETLADIMMIYDNYGIKTQVIGASIRNTYHVLEASRIGVDIITISPSILNAMILNNLTSTGIEKFAADWEKHN